MKGSAHKHNLAIDLNGPNMSLFADITYREVNGVMIGSQRKNIASNLTASYRIKNFQFRNITSINSNKNTESPYGEFSQYAKMNPYWKAVNADGTIPFYAEVLDGRYQVYKPRCSTQPSIQRTLRIISTSPIISTWNGISFPG